MEERGIGRPSTYASTIGTIQDRGYVSNRGSALVPSWLAFAVTRLMEEHFSRLVDYDFTASMEEDLDAIARGDQQRAAWLRPVLLRRRGDLGRGAARPRGGPRRHRRRAISTIDIGEGIVVRVGRYGPYVEEVVPAGVDPTTGEVTDAARARATDALTACPAPRHHQRRHRPRRADPGDGPRAARATRRRRPGLGQDPATGARRRGQGRPVRPLRHRGAAGGGRAAGQGPRQGRRRRGRARHPCSRTWTSRRSTSTPRSRLLSLPRVVGTDPEDGEEITAQNGRYGPYLKKGTDSRSIETEQQLFEITLEQALAIYAQPKQRGRAAAKPPLAELGTDPVSVKPVVVKDGRFGPYVTDGETNATLRKDDDPEKITPERGYELLADKRAQGPAKKRTARKDRQEDRRPARPPPRRPPRRRPRPRARPRRHCPQGRPREGLGPRRRHVPLPPRDGPGPAHTRNPLPVAARLVERGHEVLWFASRRFHDGIAAVGATPVPYAATRDYDGERLLEEFPQLTTLRGRARSAGRMPTCSSVRPRTGSPTCRPWWPRTPVDAILCDGLSYGVGLLGEIVGIPVATFGDGPLPRRTASTGLRAGAAPDGRPDLAAAQPRRADGIPAVGLRRGAGAPRPAAGRAGPATRRPERAAGVGLADAPPAGVHAVLRVRRGRPAPTVHWVGALRPTRPAHWVPPAWWDEVRASTRPVVHVTQGSIRPDMDELVVPALRALADEDVLVVVTTGGVPAGARGALRGSPCRRTPGSASSSRTTCCCRTSHVCVTNGGYTGVTTALHHGVPLVQAGSTEEKAEIGARVAWSGVGVRIRSTSPGRARLRQRCVACCTTRRYRPRRAAGGGDAPARRGGRRAPTSSSGWPSRDGPVTEPVTPRGRRPAVSPARTSCACPGGYPR